MDGPRGRQPGRGRTFNGGNRQDEGRRDGYNNTNDRAQRFPRREPRQANPQTLQRRTVHYQVVTMDDEEWGDALEHRLNTLGHDGWRLVAIDEGRQYVFVQSD